MNKLNTFITYLDTRGYNQTTIARHKSYMIYFFLRLLENNKQFNYQGIKEYRDDMLYYVSNNTVYKYLTSISVFAHFMNIIYDDYNIRPERIDYNKYKRENGYDFGAYFPTQKQKDLTY